MNPDVPLVPNWTEDPALTTKPPVKLALFVKIIVPLPAWVSVPLPAMTLV